MSIFLSIFVTGHGIVLFFTLGTYVWAGNELTASVAFSTISVIYTIQIVAVGLASLGYDILSMIRAGSARITDVLCCEQFDEEYLDKPTDNTALEIVHLNACWNVSRSVQTSAM